MTTDAADALDVQAEKHQLESIISTLLDTSKSRGATAASVSVSKIIGLSATVRNQDIETLEFNQDYGFGITVYVGQRKGSASTSDTGHESIERTVQAAIDIARKTGEDPCAGLADPELMAGQLPDLDLDHPMGITSEKAEALALETEQALLDAGAESDGVTFASHRSIHAYGNSHGFIASYPSSRHVNSAVAIAKDASGMQRDYDYSIARKFEDLESPHHIGRQAAEKSIRRLGAKPIKTGKYPVILIPEIAAGFWGHIMSAIKGGKLYRKSSFLLDSLGQQLLPEFVDIYERPYLVGELGSRSFDSEGVATRDNTFFNKGRLESYVLNSYSARRLGLETTANAGGVHNLHITDTGEDQKQLIARMGTGLLITDVMGQGINLVTGDYSRGASGFWVEDGDIIHPVEGITIAGNLKQMMQNVQAVGTDVPSWLGTRTGSVLLDTMMVAAD